MFFYRVSESELNSSDSHYFSEWWSLFSDVFPSFNFISYFTQIKHTFICRANRTEISAHGSKRAWKHTKKVSLLVSLLMDNCLELFVSVRFLFFFRLFTHTHTRRINASPLSTFLVDHGIHRPKFKWRVQKMNCHRMLLVTLFFRVHHMSWLTETLKKKN